MGPSSGPDPAGLINPLELPKLNNKGRKYDRILEQADDWDDDHLFWEHEQKRKALALDKKEKRDTIEFKKKIDNYKYAGTLKIP